MVYPKTPYPQNSKNDQELADMTQVLVLNDEKNEKKTSKSDNYHWIVYKQVK